MLDAAELQHKMGSTLSTVLPHPHFNAVHGLGLGIKVQLFTTNAKICDATNLPSISIDMKP